MKTIEVTVLDYYNRPGYYPFMSEELFKILETAFLEDKITVSAPKSLFDEMIYNLNNSEKSWKQKQ